MFPRLTFMIFDTCARPDIGQRYRAMSRTPLALPTGCRVALSPYPAEETGMYFAIRFADLIWEP